MDLSALFADPELMQRLTEAGVFPDEMDLLSQQMKRAEAMRKTPAAKGYEVGGTYKAASPLEHLATALGGFMGQRDIQRTSTQQNDALERMRANAMALARALRGGNDSPQPYDWAPVGPAPVEY